METRKRYIRNEKRERKARRNRERKEDDVPSRCPSTSSFGTTLPSLLTHALPSSLFHSLCNFPFILFVISLYVIHSLLSFPLSHFPKNIYSQVTGECHTKDTEKGVFPSPSPLFFLPFSLFSSFLSLTLYHHLSCEFHSRVFPFLSLYLQKILSFFHSGFPNERGIEQGVKS